MTCETTFTPFGGWRVTGHYVPLGGDKCLECGLPAQDLSYFTKRVFDGCFPDVCFSDLQRPHGTINGLESPKDGDGFCKTIGHGLCIRCEAEKKLKRLGFVRATKQPSKLAQLLRELADHL